MVTRFARLALLLAALVVPSAAAAAPTISGADGDVWNAASPAPTYTITANRGPWMEWRLDGGPWVRERWPVVAVTLAPISDGQHVLSARGSRGDDDNDDDDDDDDDEVARRRFRVDRVPPRIEIREPRPGAVYAQGEVLAARYSCSGAVSCAGPVGNGQPLPTATAGPASFVVRALDDAGNAAAARADYAVAPAASAPIGPLASAPPPAPAPARGLPGARRSRLLSPPAGSRLTTLRPVLRWRPRARARLYNVQVFLLEGGAPRKVLSAFPRGARLRVPRGTLAFGQRYVWRVWPHLASRYARGPIGLSFFDVARPVRPAAAQSPVGRRVAQAAP